MNVLQFIQCTKWTGLERPRVKQPCRRRFTLDIRCSGPSNFVRHLDLCFGRLLASSHVGGLRRNCQPFLAHLLQVQSLDVNFRTDWVFCCHGLRILLLSLFQIDCQTCYLWRNAVTFTIAGLTRLCLDWSARICTGSIVIKFHSLIVIDRVILFKRITATDIAGESVDSRYFGRPSGSLVPGSTPYFITPLFNQCIAYLLHL